MQILFKENIMKKERKQYTWKNGKISHKNIYYEQNGYDANRHSCYSLHYHLVVVTKYRHPVITGNLKNKLIEITKDFFENKHDCIIESIETNIDHIHIIFRSKPQIQLSVIINSYKTISSRLIRKEFSKDLEPFYWKPYFWNMSYFIATVGDTDLKTITHYVESQGQKQKNLTPEQQEVLKKFDSNPS